MELSGARYTVGVNTSERTGWFERKSDGMGGGLWFEGDCKTLSDFDGVYELPREVALLLESAGYIVGDDFKQE